jgi:hypothetical protein
VQVLLLLLLQVYDGCASIAASDNISGVPLVNATTAIDAATAATADNDTYNYCCSSATALTVVVL